MASECFTKTLLRPGSVSKNGIRESHAPTSEEGIHFSALVVRFGGNHAPLAIVPGKLNVSPCA